MKWELVGIGDGDYDVKEEVVEGEELGESNPVENNEINSDEENEQQQAINGRVEKGEAKQDKEDLGMSGTGLDIHTSIMRTNDFFSSKFFKECPLGAIKVLAKFVEFCPLFLLFLSCVPILGKVC